MNIFNQVIDTINNFILLPVVGVAFGIQIIYILLFFLKAKTYPPAKVKHRFGIVIPARNEESVIAETVKCILASQYPKDMFDVYVVADNCTDKTAELARAAGATVFERTDPDPKHHRAGYALKFLFEKIMELRPGYYEAFIKFDADNLMEPDYISRMNDAFDAGVKSAKGYSNSKNMGQNKVAGISGLWYIRDNRFNCNFRSAVGQGTMLGGAGMMFAAEIIEKHGWDCLETSDDAEFTMRRLNEDKIKTMYVKDAIVYEDQPSTIKDTYKRYKRMSRPLCKLFFTQGCKSFGLFFARWKWTYLDMFLTLLFVPVCVLLCIWMPLYYGYYIIYNAVMGLAYGVAECATKFWDVMILIGYVVAFAYLLAFILQAFLALGLERKRIKAPMKKMIPVALLFPFFMLIYAVAITIGAFAKPSWEQIKRNTASDLSPAPAQGNAEPQTPNAENIDNSDNAMTAEVVENNHGGENVESGVSGEGENVE